MARATVPLGRSLLEAQFNERQCCGSLSGLVNHWLFLDRTLHYRPGTTLAAVSGAIPKRLGNLPLGLGAWSGDVGGEDARTGDACGRHGPSQAAPELQPAARHRQNEIRLQEKPFPFPLPFTLLAGI